MSVITLYAQGNVTDTDTPFLATWVGFDCNCYGGTGTKMAGPVLDLTFAVEGKTFDLGPGGSSYYAEWFQGLSGSGAIMPNFQFLQAQGWSSIPGQTGDNGTVWGYSVTTGTDGPNGYGGRGVAYLPDGSSYALSVLHIGPHTVPAPELGSGMVGAAVLGAVLLLMRFRQAHPRGGF